MKSLLILPQDRSYTETFIAYREYVSRCEKNGVWPPYDYATWFRCRHQF